MRTGCVTIHHPAAGLNPVVEAGAWGRGMWQEAAVGWRAADGWEAAGGPVAQSVQCPRVGMVGLEIAVLVE